MTFRRDLAWTEPFMPAVLQIVGPRLVRPAPLVLDREEATDLIVLTASDLRVGVRLRRPGYNDRFPSEFTIRRERDSGARTEWQKVMYDGWGDWLFYGHASGDAAVWPWMIVDLCRLRGVLIKHPFTRHRCDRKDRVTKRCGPSGHTCWWGEQSVGDGTHFVFFNVARSPALRAALVASDGIDDADDFPALEQGGSHR